LAAPANAIGVDDAGSGAAAPHVIGHHKSFCFVIEALAQGIFADKPSQTQQTFFKSTISAGNLRKLYSNTQFRHEGFDLRDDACRADPKGTASQEKT
jgi:hypothetical protein